MIKEFIKSITSKIVQVSVEVLASLTKTSLTKRVQKESCLWTSESNPQLIEAVSMQLKDQNAQMILGKLQDLEKAVYHLASRQKEVIEKQEVAEQIAVSTNTSVEEILHGLEASIDDTGAELMDDQDAMAGKGSSTLN